MSFKLPIMHPKWFSSAFPQTGPTVDTGRALISRPNLIQIVLTSELQLWPVCHIEGTNSILTESPHSLQSTKEGCKMWLQARARSFKTPWTASEWALTFHLQSLRAELCLDKALRIQDTSSCFFSDLSILVTFSTISLYLASLLGTFSNF
jgi:hypothetical protein